MRLKDGVVKRTVAYAIAPLLVLLAGIVVHQWRQRSSRAERDAARQADREERRANFVFRMEDPRVRVLERRAEQLRKGLVDAVNRDLGEQARQTFEQEDFGSRFRLAPAEGQMHTLQSEEKSPERKPRDPGGP